MAVTRIFAALLALALVGTGSSCRRDTEKTVLGFLVKQPEEPWFQHEWKGARRAAVQYGFELREIAVQDGAKVMTAIDTLAAAGAKGFVICTPDVRLGPAIVNKANSYGMKVVAVDDQFIGADGNVMPNVPYLGMSATQIGRASGVELMAQMKHRGWRAEETGACIVTFEQLDTARHRTDGIIAALVEGGFPRERILKSAQKTTDVPGSLDAANILLTQHPEVKRWLVAGMNDTATLGAVRAMEGRGFTAADVIGIGINGTDCLDELRKSAPTGFFGSIFVSAPQEGFRTAEMLYRWVNQGIEPPADTRTEGIFIHRDNFEAILRAEGIID